MSHFDDKDLEGLLNNLDDARYLILSALADWETEHGQDYNAKAWMWLRDHKKWPSKRKDPYSKYSTKNNYVYGWNFVVHKSKDGMTDWTMKGFITAHLKGLANIPRIALFRRESPATVNSNAKESQALYGIIPNVVKWIKLLENHGLDDLNLQD